jgi:hypothetical protein
MQAPTQNQRPSNTSALGHPLRELDVRVCPEGHLICLEWAIPEISAFLKQRAKPGVVGTFKEALAADTWVAAMCGMSLLAFAAVAWRPGRSSRTLAIDLILLAANYTCVHLNANDLLMQAVLLRIEADQPGHQTTDAMVRDAVHVLRNVIWDQVRALRPRD